MQPPHVYLQTGLFNMHVGAKCGGHSAKYTVILGKFKLANLTYVSPQLSYWDACGLIICMQ